MTDRGGYQYPPPADWQRFERLARDLFVYRWNDPDTMLNGRSGQAQAGVDVYGRQDGRGAFHGVQCKGRDGRFGHQVTESELREEALKARTFEPRLESFTLITTAPTDVQLQGVARQLTIDNEAEGWFAVHYVGWDQLQSWMSPYDDLWETHFPEFAPPRRSADRALQIIMPEGLATAQVQVQQTELLTQILAALQSGQALDGSSIAADGQSSRDPLDDRIDEMRDLLESEPVVALRMLQRLQAQQPDVSQVARFRIVTNIASAQLRMRNFAAAAAGFLAAYAIAPSSEKALTNRALGYLLRDDYQRGYEAAKLAIAAHPQSTTPYVFLINAAAVYRPDIDPRELLPRVLLSEDQVVHALAYAYRRRRNEDEARRWAIRACVLAPERHETRVSVGEALLSEVVDHDEAAQFGVLRDEKDRPALEKGCRLLAQVWREVAGTGAAAGSVDIACNLVLVYRLLGRIDDADAVLEAARRAAPENPTVVDLTLMLAVSREDMPKALSLLRGHEAQFRRDRPVAAAEILAANGDFDAALAWIADETRDDKIDGAHPLAIGHETSWILARDGQERARARIRRRLVLLPYDAASWIAAADIALSAGDRDEAKAYVWRADMCLTAAASFAVVDVVADAAYLTGLREIALRRYQAVAPVGRHSEALLRAFECASRTDNRHTALVMWRKLPPALHDHPDYIWIAALPYERIGDRLEGKRLLEAYRRHRPAEIVAFTNWAIVARELGLHDEVASALKMPLDHLVGSPQARTMLARLLADFGYPDRAMDQAYQGFREGRRDPIVLTRVAGFALTSGIDPRQEQVGTNSAVRLRFVDSAEEQTIVIESARDADPALNEFAPTHTLAIAVLGQHRGAVVEVGPSARRAEIVDIRHKAANAVETISSSFDTWFPDEGGFQRVHVPERPDGARDLQAVQAVAADAERSREELVQAFRQAPVPIGVMAKLLGRHPVDVVRWMSSRPDITLHMCAGTVEELQAALALVTEARGFVLDPVTIATIVSFELETVLAETLPRLCVTQSTIDCLSQLAEQRRQPSIGRLGTVNGELRLHEVTEAERRHEIESAERMVRFATDRCERLVAVPASEAPPVWRNVAERMDDTFGDTVYAASGAALPILSDDMTFRTLAKFGLQVDGVWLQPVLMCALARGNLALKRYAEIAAFYLEARFNLVAVDQPVLWSLASTSTIPDLRMFSLAVGAFQDPRVTLDSTLMVLGGLLRQVWSSGLPQRNREWITNRALDAILWERSWLAAGVLSELPKLSPPERRHELQAIAIRWRAGHFL